MHCEINAQCRMVEEQDGHFASTWRQKIKEAGKRRQNKGKNQ